MSRPRDGSILKPISIFHSARAGSFGNSRLPRCSGNQRAAATGARHHPTAPDRAAAERPVSSSDHRETWVETLAFNADYEPTRDTTA